ncbi:ATP-binding cassette domain-containing protein [Flammeovirga aprica]|uniref:ATP-binding cassette domain-containing protein n=1 Tax=Flammeovirga aprica JL-4 TaxID=694437 RepID=A0A7X9S004_9BACT|nr:ATP-binding cassette domain-containing protein [Flammeovirga aprica]NME71868.1 ATP-binding cassette domain-containing protein [Flammeovirga aprica JL-4]
MISINLHKRIGGNKTESHFQLSFQSEDIIGITGPSGKGKTTFLKVIAGLVHCEKGEINFHDAVWLDQSSNIFLPPQKRNVGFIFQDYALFPNMTVIQNILFAKTDAFGEKELNKLIECFEIKPLLNQKVNTLSGGQKQRVAISRALVQLPNILLMDEPFSALDFRVKQKVIDYIKVYHQTFKIPLLINTHQIHELSVLTDKIYELNAEKLEVLESKKTAHHTGNVIRIDRQNQLMEVMVNNVHYTLPLKHNIEEGDSIQLSIE